MLALGDSEQIPRPLQLHNSAMSPASPTHCHRHDKTPASRGRRPVVTTAATPSADRGGSGCCRIGSGPHVMQLLPDSRQCGQDLAMGDDQGFDPGEHIVLEGLEQSPVALWELG